MLPEGDAAVLQDDYYTAPWLTGRDGAYFTLRSLRNGSNDSVVTPVRVEAITFVACAL